MFREITMRAQRRVVRKILCVLGAVVVMGLASAGPAAAGSNSSAARCDGTQNAVLTVTLTGFPPSTSSPNWIKVDDNAAHLEDAGFGQSFRKTYRATPAADHVFHLWVWSNDDPKWQYGRSFYAEYRVAVCAAAAPPPAPAPAVTSTSPTPATTTSRTAATKSTAHSPSQTAVTMSGTGSMVPISAPGNPGAYPVANAADVEGTDNWILLLVIGMVLLAGGLTVLLLIRRRSSRAPDGSRHRSD